MRLMIETTAPLSETDYKILSLLLARHEAVAPKEGTLAAAIHDVNKDKPEPEAKPEPKPKPSPAVKPEAKPEPEPEPEAEQDSPVSDELLDQAVSKAKALMQDGKKTAVKQALETAGVARVGAIETEGQAHAFLAALEG